MVQSPEPLKRFGLWSVFEGGDMENHKLGYEITSDRLTEPDWWLIFSTEPNFNFNDFIPAFFFACKQAKVEKLNLDLNFL